MGIMRTLCPNLDREDGLETVLEVPIPEEMFPPSKTKWPNMISSWIKSSPIRPHHSSLFSDPSSQIQLLLGVIGAPLIPLPIPSHNTLDKNIKDHPIESSTAKYIIQQYIASMGGEHALNTIDSMYAMGKVTMMASEFSAGDELSSNVRGDNNNKATRAKGVRNNGEIGGFVLWQKRPSLWCLELVLSGTKISAGSDGKVAWRQTPWNNSHASRGPPRPLRRSLQGLDPRLIANLFNEAICIGEKTVNEEDCFVLKLEAHPSTLVARSSSNVEIIRHTVWGYFSERTGLLIQLEDTHLLRIKTSKSDSIFWETTMESLIQDYRTIDGVNIAHSGKTSVSLFRYGEHPENHSRTRMEETWSIEEVDFNIKGLSLDCFLPPSDLKKEDDGYNTSILPNSTKVSDKEQCLPLAKGGNLMNGTAKVVAIDDDYSESFDDRERM